VTQAGPPPEREHALRNYLCVILGFADLLLTDMGPHDPQRTHVEEIKIAASAAMAIVAGESKDRT